MFWRVTESDQHPKQTLVPMRPDRDLIALGNAPERQGHRRHQLGIVAGTARDHLVQRSQVAHTVGGKVRRRPRAGCGTLLARVSREHAAERVFAQRHPEWCLPALALAAFGKPPCEPEMIRMKMRGQYAQQRLAVERGIEDLLPGGARRLAADAAIDRGETGATLDLVIEQPQIDVIE